MRARPKLLPVIDAARCTGCGWCVGACPEHLLTLQTIEWKKTSVLHAAERCTGCRKCEVKCPFQVIAMGALDLLVPPAAFSSAARPA